MVQIALTGLILFAAFSSSATGTVLVGKVEHSATLQPLDSALAVGQVFDPSKLPIDETKPTNNWYKIPPWLAGTWHKESQTDYYRYNFKTSTTDTATRVTTAKSTGTWGTQKDQQGDIWQFDPAPFVATVDSGDDYVVQMVRQSEPLEASAERFIRRSVDTQIRVSKSDGVVKSIESGEQITTYSPQQEELIKRETSAKVFDVSGEPVLLGKSFAYESKIAQFAPQDQYKGKDMKDLFQKFQKGLAETAYAAQP